VLSTVCLKFFGSAAEFDAQHVKKCISSKVLTQVHQLLMNLFDGLKLSIVPLPTMSVKDHQITLKALD